MAGELLESGHTGAAAAAMVGVCRWHLFVVCCVILFLGGCVHEFQMELSP